MPQAKGHVFIFNPSDPFIGQRLSKAISYLLDMRKIQKPEWLLFGEECRDKRMPTLKFGKSPRRAEDTMYRWWLEAQQKHGYPGTVHDWHYLLGYR